MLRRVLRHLATATLTATALVAVPTPAAQADNPVTPGDFQGHGFDQCVAPNQKAMDAWMQNSPFSAVGIYISGASRGCRSQPNLTPTWVSTQLRKGWRLLPITLGPQASCHPSFPRYGNDPTIDPRRGTHGNYSLARAQARAEAETAVQVAAGLGIVKGSTLWYDLEGFDHTRTDCRESALAFLSAWTVKIRQLGYVSGVYSSAGSGLKALDDARVLRPTKYVMPDQIWIARWDGVANTSTSYLREDGWRPGGRMKQYRGDHRETWGGITIDIDSNWLDLGRGLYAAPESHCDGTRVDFASYARLQAGTTRAAMTKALQCLLSERGFYAGRIHGYYGPAVVRAVNRWKSSIAQPADGVVSSADWQRLHARGTTVVLKTGSTGVVVRRAQRSLNAAGAGLTVSGVYDAPTRSAVLDYQRAVGMKATGIVTWGTWQRLKAGRR